MFTCNYLALIIVVTCCLHRFSKITHLASDVWHDWDVSLHVSTFFYCFMYCVCLLFFFLMYCLLSLYLLSDAFSVPSITSAENMFKWVRRVSIYNFPSWCLKFCLPILLHFSQTCEFWSSKANWRLRFSLLLIILTDLLGNKTLL